MKGYLLHASFLASAYELPKDTCKKVWKALHFISRNPRWNSGSTTASSTGVREDGADERQKDADR
jgi:hypothetical protein